MEKYKGNLKSKLPKTGITIFTVMSKLAAEHKAINLSQGFPDFSGDEKLIERVAHYMRSGYNQYAPMQGVPVLRERISEIVESLYGAKYNPESEINITAGATQAIYTAITAVVREGDEVIVFEPAYDCYVPAIEICGAKPVFVTLNENDYSIDWEKVKKCISHRTRMIIVNTPHNPSGTILSPQDIKMLEKITDNTDIIVLSDEVYEHMVLDESLHQSVARFPSLASRSFIVSSFGKTIHHTGWKLGYVLAPENLMIEFRKIHQYLVFTCNTPIQYALADYLADSQTYLQVKNLYRAKRDLFNSLIKNSAFEFIPSTGTYFQLLKYSKITQEPDTEFAIRLTRDFGLAAIPVSVFYNKPFDNKVLRFCFAKKDETLHAAAEIINRIKA